MSYGNKEVIGLTAAFKVGTGGVTAGAAVKLDASGDVVLGTAATEVIIGVALTTQLISETVSVQLAGVAKMVASGTVTLGDQVEVGAAGVVLTAGGATAYSIGVALTTAATTGRVMVLLNLPNCATPANS